MEDKEKNNDFVSFSILSFEKTKGTAIILFFFNRVPFFESRAFCNYSINFWISAVER